MREIRTEIRQVIKGTKVRTFGTFRTRRRRAKHHPDPFVFPQTLDALFESTSLNNPVANWSLIKLVNKLIN